MNFEELYKRVQYTIGLEDTTANDEVALAKAYVNEGVVDILVRTRPYTREICFTMTGGTHAHDMSSAIIAIKDIRLPDSPKCLDPMTREDILLAQFTGVAGFAYEEPMIWISPVPDVDTDFIAYGVFRPAPMTDISHDPASFTYGGLAPEFHSAIVNYALWKGGEYLQHEQSGGGERWRTLYEGQDGMGGDIARIKRILAKRVTAQGQRRRDLTGHLGALSTSGSYTTSG